MTTVVAAKALPCRSAPPLRAARPAAGGAAPRLAAATRRRASFGAAAPRCAAARASSGETPEAASDAHNKVRLAARRSKLWQLHNARLTVNGPRRWWSRLRVCSRPPAAAHQAWAPARREAGPGRCEPGRKLRRAGCDVGRRGGAKEPTRSSLDARGRRCRTSTCPSRPRCVAYVWWVSAARTRPPGGLTAPATRVPVKPSSDDRRPPRRRSLWTRTSTRSRRASLTTLRATGHSKSTRC
jgi:hypothetical protein